MLPYILIGVAVVIIAFVVLVAMRPAEFCIERSAEIGATPEGVFAIINDLHAWEKWSPWEKLDRNMKKTFTGPEAGPGAGMAWAGNKKAGEGRISIVESKPAEFVAMKLEMLSPFPATNQVRFTLTPSGGGTRVTWTMIGHNGFMGKAFSMVCNLDKMVGKDFEEGLANLNQVAQGVGVSG